MRRWLLVLLASLALLIPATQVSARDTYVVNGYLIWLGTYPPDYQPPIGWSGWIWLGNCWGAYWTGS
jgi:hypothetical protein